METMEAFAARVTAAFREAFPEDGRRLVFGEGCAERPPVLLIGEAPGRHEEEQGRPFVGQAGKNLDEFLRVLELERGAIRIANVVKVRPTRVSAKGTVSNRPPDRRELAFFRPYLLEETALVRPGLIVTLGNTALQSFTDDTIGACHGRRQTVTVAGQSYGLFPLYHPAAVIYDRSLREVYLEDLQALKKELGEG